MPTARELLEQADALMRRNRAAAAPEPLLAPEPAPAPVPSPVSATAQAGTASPLAQEAREPILVPPVTLEPVAERATLAPIVSVPATVAPVRPDDLLPDDDFPLLTDAVEALDAMPAHAQGREEAPAGEMPTDEGEPLEWLEHPDDSPSIIDEAPDSIAMVPPISRHQDEATQTAPAATPAGDGATGTAHLVEAMIAAAPSPDAETVAELTAHAAPDISAAEEGTPAHAHPAIGVGALAAVTALPEVPTQGMSAAAVEARWQALAEEIRTQVLQRIDLFTDTGLHEQLGQRLQPIVDRAGADLVNAINQHVGEILRSYVAEAIEREIEHWRADR